MIAIWLKRMWAAKRYKEPLVYPSLQVALFSLRQALGFELAELELELGKSGLTRLERTGRGFNAGMLYRLAAIAKRHSLPGLSHYFEMQAGRMKLYGRKNERLEESGIPQNDGGFA